MKQMVAIVLALLLFAAPGCADERNLGTRCGDFWYDLNDDGTARLTACFNVDETLELPGELDSYPLTDRSKGISVLLPGACSRS